MARAAGSVSCSAIVITRNALTRNALPVTDTIFGCDFRADLALGELQQTAQPHRQTAGCADLVAARPPRVQVFLDRDRAPRRPAVDRSQIFDAGAIALLLVQQSQD